jgi:hypothetical protein
MVKLDAGNVLLKPSHRRQLMSWLRRSAKLGKQLGDFDLTIRLSKSGNQHEAVAAVHDRAGDFTCRTRKRDWMDALRELILRLVARLHDQRLARAFA